jgi:site-specific DNA-cytosine methylase
LGYGPFDVVLASPPCNKFSVASAHLYWRGGVPAGKDTLDAIALVKHTMDLIRGCDSVFWFMENPRGMLRHVIGLPPVTLFYAQYGENRLKPTDIWGVHPPGFREMQILDKSKLTYAPNGTRDEGDVELRSKVPYALSLAVCRLCEEALN